VKNASTTKKVLGLLGGAALGLLGHVQPADACGCFTPPDPSVPIVQAGERIIFAQANGQVTAHIQIQYQGDAKDFGWLLPLPAVPTLNLGVDELFNQLTATTQPKYKLNRVYEGNCAFNPGRNGGFNSAPTAAGASGGAGGDVQSPQSPLVIQSSIGPYDYAVLKADSKDAMLNWLATNHYFVPAGTDGSVGPYIRPGAFFLALKLQSGKSAGDLQPVVVNYASDLPMIPIVLTSTGAKPDMGIQVWMLGAGRAIPRNYYHTVIDDALIDWISAGQNYNDVIIKATHEADGRHTFVTEYAGSSSVMRNLLNPPNRFGVQSELAGQVDAQHFVDYLFQHQFGQVNTANGGGGPGPVAFYGQLTSQELAILGKYIPEPAALQQKGIQPQYFYQSIDYYLGQYRMQFPNDFAGWTLNYQPVMMAQELWDRVVTPTLQAGGMFDQFPYLTRLYTTLSPEDMNKDPVFSWNPTLADWPNEHDGTLTYHCGYFGRDSQATTPATLVTASGWIIQYPYGTGTAFTPPSTLPASQQIQILAEEGDAQVVVDNTAAIRDGLPNGHGGCGVSLGSRATETAGGLVLLVFAGSMLIVSGRRRSA